MNYIGSKYSLLDFLYEKIMGVVGKKNLVFCDMFAGTGIVGAYFKEKGFKVISNDIQYYSYVLNYCYQKDCDNNNEIYDYLNNLELKENGFIYNNYCYGSGSNRLYFTDNNGKKIDTIRMEIEKLYNNNKITENQYYCLIASLINSADKVANTAAVYGAFLKKIKKSASKELVLEPLKKYEGFEGRVYKKDSNELINEIEGDILYLDPPYNSRQYSGNYHLLETLAYYDNPEIKGVTGLRKEAIKSKYCSKLTVKEELEYIIKNAKFKYIFLSYNNEGLINIYEIKEIFEKYGEYRLFEKKDYQRFQSDKDENRNIKAKKTIEYLHCLIKEGN